MHRLTQTCLLLCCLLLSLGVSKGFGQHKTIKTFPVRTFYEDNGLISNNIYATAQSSAGELWFGSAKGISTFDGIRWDHVAGSESFPFSHRSMLVALAGDSLMQLGLDPKGNSKLRLYYKGGFTELGTFPNPPIPNKAQGFNAAVLQTKQYLHMALLTSEFLWLREGINSQWQKIKLPPQIDSEQVTKLVFYQNTLHLLTTRGLFSYNANRKKFQPLWPSLLGNKVIVSASTSPNGEQLYLLGNNWLAECSNNRLRFLETRLFEQEAPFSPLSNYNIVVTQSGRLVFQINNSLFLLNPRTGFLEPFRLTNNFSTAIPTAVFEDSERNLWFSTLRGVAMLNNLRFATMDKVVGLPDSEISTIYQIDSGTVLLGSNLGINVLKNYCWQQKAGGDTYYSNSSYRVMDACRFDSDRIAVAGNSQGLGILSGPNYSKTDWHPLPEGLLAVSVAVLDNKLLIGTDKGKVLSFDGNRFSIFLDLQQDQYLRRLCIDSKGCLLMLSSRGLFRYDKEDKALLQINSKAAQADNLFSLLNWKGRTLLGTADGLWELKGNKLAPLKDLISLQRPVYTMMLDQKGGLWLGTDKGVYVYKNKVLKNFNSYNGLAGQEVNRNALVEMKDGRIWIGTDRGLSIYDPHYDEEYAIRPRLRLKEIRSNERLLAAAADYQLESEQNSLEFVFQPLSFSLPEALEYRYRLLGLEKNWTYANNYRQNSVRFSRLPPGTYKFAIQARLQGGSWSEVAFSPKLTIAWPFYLQWWFIGLCILFIGLLGYVTHSIIQHKNNEKRLKAAIDDKKALVKKSEAKFEAVWESMDTSVLVCNQQGKIIMCNPSFCSLFKYTPEELLGKEVSEVLEHSRFSKEFIEEWYRTPAVLRFELEIKADGLHHYLLTTFSHLSKLSPHEPLLVIGLKDISLQKLTEMKNLRLNELLVRQNRDLVKKELELATFNRELLKRQKELEEALQVLEARNFELDQFVYKTSHDLRAPIASAIGLLNIMKMEGQNASWPQYVELIMRSLQKQDSFIKAMLNFSKTARATEKPEPVDFEQFMEQCLSDLQYIPGYESISKRIKVNDPYGNFYSDKMKINIILSNILSNSIKYRDPQKTSRLEVVIDVDSRQAQIIISDNGIGINNNYLQHIFDMFYRATERSDGSGLGLYIVKQTVERLGGKIEVSSDLGLGSCFKIQIPNLFKEQLSTMPVLSPKAPARDESSVVK